MTFAYCPPGIFTIGSPKTEEGRNSDEAQSMVRLKEGFWMGQTEVTQQQWAALMPDNPSEFKGEDLPVDSVNRVDAQAFIDKLNQNSPPGVGWRYSLPSEAQWEYACRAGTQTVFNFGDELDGSQAYCNGNFPYGTTAKGAVQRGTCAVAGRKPNAWGLYDMHGNVWEWCTDFYNEKGAGSGKRDAAGSNLSVLRGGAWSDIAQLCRSARRLSCFTDYSSNGLGLRVAMVPK